MLIFANSAIQGYDRYFFKELKNELQKGVHKKGHPFRYGTFATIGLETLPRLRTVVLRRVSENLNLTFYIDKRSKKPIHIKENNKVSLLFYHPKQLLQLKIVGLASIITDESILKNIGVAYSPIRAKTTVLRMHQEVPFQILIRCNTLIKKAIFVRL